MLASIMIVISPKGVDGFYAWYNSKICFSAANAPPKQQNPLFRSPSPSPTGHQSRCRLWPCHPQFHRRHAGCCRKSLNLLRQRAQLNSGHCFTGGRPPTPRLFIEHWWSSTCEAASPIESSSPSCFPTPPPWSPWPRSCSPGGRPSSPQGKWRGGRRRRSSDPILGRWQAACLRSPSPQDPSGGKKRFHWHI